MRPFNIVYCELILKKKYDEKLKSYVNRFLLLLNIRFFIHMQLIYSCLNKIALKRKFILIITAIHRHAYMHTCTVKTCKISEKNLCFLTFFIVIFYCVLL